MKDIETVSDNDMVTKKVPVIEMAKPPAPPPGDVKHGQGIRAIVEARKADLELAFARIRAGRAPSQQIDTIHAALDAVVGMLTGDLDNISEVTAAQLSQWLETSKFLIEQKLAPVAPKPAAPEVEEPCVEVSKPKDEAV